MAVCLAVICIRGPAIPNREALERALATIEDGAAALAFSAGSAATLAVLQSLAPGDHVLAGSDVFYGTLILLKSLMSNWGLTSLAGQHAGPGRD